MSEDIIIPKRVTIETIFGCNAHCIMCPINLPTQRKKMVMPYDDFLTIIDKLEAHKTKFEMMDLFGLGEPLLDPHIFKRITHLKTRGFKNIGLSTNAQLLTENKQKQLLDSGIDTVIFSVDGLASETHEAIRQGTTHEVVVRHIEQIVNRRSAGGYKTRFVLRFIRQESNYGEYEGFIEYWKARIDPGRKDFISIFDAHSWGGEVTHKNALLGDNGVDTEIERKACPIISEILYILADGTVPLCNEDWHSAQFKFGNAVTEDPISIFNSSRFAKIRKLHAQGKKTTLDICRECTVLYSFETKQTIT